MGYQQENRKMDQVMTYEDALEKIGSGRFQIIMVIVGGFILFSSYISVGSVAYILPAAQCDLNMDSLAKGRLASVGFMGLIMSCHLWGFLSDTLGRRYILIRCLIMDGLLYIVTSLVPYFPMILVLRLFHGFISSGGVASIYAYIGEFMTNKNRTKALLASSMVASFAYFITPLMAWLTIPGTWKIPIYPGLIFRPWRLFYAICSVPSLICFVLIYFLPESPKFLLAKGRTAKSIEILEKIHLFNNNSKEDHLYLKDIRIDENEKVAKLDSSVSKVVGFFKLMWNQTAPLFTKQHRLNVSLVCLSLFFTYFCNGGMYLWLPESFNRLAIFRRETKNEYASYCEVVQYNIKSHFKNINNHLVGDFNSTDLVSPTTSYPIVCSDVVDVSVYYYLGVLGFIQTLNLAFITLISRYFNKKILLSALTSIAFLAATGLRYVHLTNFAVYDACLNIISTGAMIPIINSVVVEIFPTNLRGMAACLTLMSCRLGTVLTNIIAGSLIDSHCNEFIYCFMVVMALCLMCIMIIPTKPKNQESIINRAEEG